MKPKVLIFLISLIIFEYSCTKCRNVDRYELSDFEKQMIPYELGHSVSFIDSINQPLFMTVTEAKTTWMGYWECEKFEQLSVRMNSENSNLDISLYLNHEYGECVNIDIGLYKYSRFHLYYNAEGQFAFDPRGQYIHDSLEINNKIYYSVVESNIYSPTSANEYEYNERMPFRLLYNKTDGILQLEDANKILLTINK
ncbi:MAG: hypothetical protein FWH18_04900 [Marinilabiliaceae bacterium]|nr:hypothetical protein [Marinilabiliaceae bacterium]